MAEPLRIHYPAELPVSARRDDIARALRDHQVVIVAGETGSGKTTQLPKILLEMGYQSIGHTQPRRIAARAIAERVAEELGTSVGEVVGYRVRFTDQVGASTRITVMTDGILLNALQRDRELRRYDAIIIDEAHERSLTIDFLLGYLRPLLPRRPDLRVIVTSATIDPESFARHFAIDGVPAPIIEVSGRTYPVEVRYRPLVAEVAEPKTGDDDAADESEDRDALQGIQDALDELGREPAGDVLVFLSGENEIRDAQDALANRPGIQVLPLYGRLSAADQHRVFETPPPGTRRRVILATNVAETSLTVPGIRYVIDAGTARISRYSVRSKIQRLPIEAISQASARQRAGRAGRTSDGIAIRLYSEDDFERRPAFTDPEILRTNLAAVILQMLSLRLGDIREFPFLTPPDSRGVKDGMDLLTELGAIAPSRADPAQPRVTTIGTQLTRLPLDPRLARMVLESKRHGTTREVIAIVAGLSIQDVRERPLERRAQADQAHARFTDPTSDFLTLLNLWNHLQDRRAELSGNAFRRLVRSEYLNALRVREWQDVVRQLERAGRELGLVLASPHVDPDGIHRSLLAGLLSHLGLHDRQKKDYLGARQTRFVIFPGSGLAKKQPDAVMAAELVETSRLFARTVARIDPAWAEPIAGDLVKRSHSEPHWERKQGAVIGYERVTLFGVPIVSRRRIQYSTVDLPYARDLFIRNALIDADWDVRGAAAQFQRANAALRKRLGEVEERTRRRDLLHDDEALFDFYDARLPAEVASMRDFEGWWRTARAEQPDLLTMTESDLLGETEPELDAARYPDTWRQADQTLRLGYRFEPGHPDDGVTVTVPLALLPGLSPDGFDWQVPGLRVELVTALIKALPKAIRKHVVPAADWARRLLDALPADPEGPLAEALAHQITVLTHQRTEAADFDWDRVPAHLRMSFAVADERGAIIGRHKELRALQAGLAPKARASVARAAERTAVPAAAGDPAAGGSAAAGRRTPIERTGITAWDFDVLDAVRDTTVGGNPVRAYPALLDDGSSVRIQLMATPEDRDRAHRSGVLRLLMLAIPAPTSYIQEHLTAAEKLALATSPYPSTATLFADCLHACLSEQLGDADVRTRAEFERVRDAASARIVDGMFDTVSRVAAVLATAREADRAIREATSLAFVAPLTDARAQLDALVFPGFVGLTGTTLLRRLPVYLNGLIHRVAKLPDHPGRDRAWQNEVQTATARYLEAGGSLPLTPGLAPGLVRVRWLLEELRLSLFAQHLPTAESVSVQRITRALAPGR